MQPILQVRDLRFCYDSGAPALDGVSLTFGPGEIVG